MKNKRWQNIALGLAFALPVIGVYVGKRLLSKKTKQTAGILPEVTHIRIPITSLIGVHNSEATTEKPQLRIVLPEENEDTDSQVQMPSTEEAIEQFVASTEGGKYHKPDCRCAKNIKSANRVIFEDKASALEGGYKPCGSCIP